MLLVSVKYSTLPECSLSWTNYFSARIRDITSKGTWLSLHLGDRVLSLTREPEQMDDVPSTHSNAELVATNT